MRDPRLIKRDYQSGDRVRLIGEHLREHLKGKAATFKRASYVASQVCIVDVDGVGVVNLCYEEIEPERGEVTENENV